MLDLVAPLLSRIETNEAWSNPGSRLFKFHALTRTARLVYQVLQLYEVVARVTAAVICAARIQKKHVETTKTLEV